MKIICVDDEEIVLRLTVSMCEKLTQKPQVTGFGSAKEALLWLENHEADIALLDITMPGMDGLTLAIRIKQRYPNICIIFLTGYKEYALDAIHLHASGYLLKPVSMEQLQDEVDFALRGRGEKKSRPHIEVETFGEFNVFVDGKVVDFTRSKAKEVLAYLVDRQGKFLTRKMIFYTLWEGDVNYDRARQKYLDVILVSLRETLEAYGIGDMLERTKGQIRVCPEKFSCDLYRFFDGDVDAIDAYHGEYMNSYSWASMTEAYMDHVSGTGSLS